MDAKQLILTVALVAAGLFLYDAMRAEPTIDPALVDSPRAAGRDDLGSVTLAPRERAPLPDAATRTEMAALAERLAHLERAWAADRLLAAAPPAATPAPHEADIADDDLERAQRLRVALKALDEREKLESRIDVAAERSKVPLTARQRKALVETTISHRRQAVALLARMKDASAVERSEALRPLAAAFAQAVESIVPGSASATVVTHLEYLAVPGAPGQDPQAARAFMPGRGSD